MASKTIRITLDTGAYDIGPVPAGTKVTLEAGYMFAKGSRELLSEAFKNEDTDARNRAALERIAESVVTEWDCKDDLPDRSAVAAFLIALYDEDPLSASQIFDRLADKKRFGRPSLVDAEALGEG